MNEMQGAFGSYCSVTHGALQLVLCCILWWTGILGCFPCVLLYLGKDISRVQLFLLINAALEGPLLRWLPTL